MCKYLAALPRCLGVGLTDLSTRTLLSSLGATFDAAIARAEDRAAADLAISLQQDRCLRDLAVRLPVAVMLPDGRISSVATVGRDYLESRGGELIPLDRAVLRLASEGPRAETRDDELVSVLRGWARAGVWVSLSLQDGELCGPLLLGGRDHVVIRARQGDMAVALAALRAIRPAHGGSEDHADDGVPGGCHLGGRTRTVGRDRVFGVLGRMWRDRLLRDPRGSAAVESIFAMVLLLMLTLGVLQVVLVLYGRNVVISAAHEAARAAIELGRTPEEGHNIAVTTMRRAAGGLLQGMSVRVGAEAEGARYVVTVDVAGTIRTLGPVPIPVPISASATAVREELRAPR